MVAALMMLMLAVGVVVVVALMMAVLRVAVVVMAALMVAALTKLVLTVDAMGAVVVGGCRLDAVEYHRKRCQTMFHQSCSHSS